MIAFRTFKWWPNGKVSLPARARSLRDISIHSTVDGVSDIPLPFGEYVTSGVTDSDGTVTLMFDIYWSGRSGFLVRDEANLHVDDVWIQVDAPGYRRYLIPLENVTGRTVDIDDLPLPQVDVQLTPQRRE